MLPWSEVIRREHRSGGGCRAASSRVPADLNVRDGQGRGLTDTRCARRADGSGVTMFRKVRPYQQSIQEIVQYQTAAVQWTTTLRINRD